MWDRLKEMLGAPESEPEEVLGVDRAHLAAAALLVEAGRMDGDFSDDERARIETLLADRLGLAPDAAAKLLDAAEKEAEASSDFHGFTRDIKEAFDEDGRIAIMEMLWEVAYADGELHDYESSLMRRVAGLLYVPDRESGEARKRVLARLEASKG